MSAESSPEFSTIERAIGYIIQNLKSQPSLEEIAGYVHLSPFHFQKMFNNWVGVSPKKFMQFLTLEALKARSSNYSSISELAENVGLSAPSRVHDLFVTLEAMTPREYALHGKGLQIRYGFYHSPFGECLIAQTTRGICAISFVKSNHDVVVADLQRRWKDAELIEDRSPDEDFTAQIFEREQRSGDFKPLRLFVKGTQFQVKVWEALLKIPSGSLVSYQDVATEIGNPGANRAVGTAIGSNPVSWLIPCHRVIRREGVIGNYYWGSSLKAAIIGWEAEKTK